MAQLRNGMGGSDADHGHAGVKRRPDAGGAVLDRHAIPGRNGKPVRGHSVTGGIRLAARRLLGGDEHVWYGQARHCEMAQRRLDPG